MSDLKVGDKAPRWTKAGCEYCGDEFYVTRCDPKVIKEGDLACGDCIEHNKHQDEIDAKEKEIAQLKADKAELVESFDELLCWASLKMDKYGQVIKCDEGAGKFVSSGALNGIVSRLKRAIKDEDYKNWLLQKHKDTK